MEEEQSAPLFTEDMLTPLDALEMAVRLIESYQADIRNSEWVGVDLLAAGFCQGQAYRELSRDLHEALVRFRRAAGHWDGPYIYARPDGELETIY